MGSKREHHHLRRGVGFADDYIEAEEEARLPEPAVTADLIRKRATTRFVGEPLAIRKPHIDTVTSPGLNAIRAEMLRLEELAASRPLEDEEVRKLNKLAESAARFHKMDLAQAEKDAFDEMSQEELLKSIEEARRKLSE